SALYVPLESLHSQGDSLTYVFLRDGSKQEVQLGQSNANEAVVLLGLREGEDVYLSVPEGKQDKPVKLLEQLNG
ncbi:MAG TPA: RND transporter, partial [Cytophagales bacterium]|nr:RND transporter [Cytophagales bacterium]